MGELVRAQQLTETRLLIPSCQGLLLASTESDRQFLATASTPVSSMRAMGHSGYASRTHRIISNMASDYAAVFPTARIRSGMTISRPTIRSRLCVARQTRVITQ